MNSQDISILKEIYLNIYETDINPGYDGTLRTSTFRMKRRRSTSNKPTFKPRSRERDIGRHNDWKDKPLEWGKRPEAGQKLKRRLGAVVSTRRREDKEVGIRKEDVYDIILSHLLDEGYAETKEFAERIMVNMSEAWREEILDEAAKDQSE